MYHLETQETIKQNFADIEQKFPVDNWIIDGIHLWPYIRIKLYFDMLTSTNPKKNETTNRNTKNNRPGFSTYTRALLKIIQAFFSLEIFYFNLKPKKILFFGSHFHRVLQDGNYFNRFYDSIVEQHDLQNEVYMVEYQKVYSNTYNQKAVIPLVKHLNNYKLLQKLKTNTSTLNQSINLENYDDFCNYLMGLNLDPKKINITKTDLKNWAIKINSLKNFYFRFYKKTKPSMIVFLGYYGYDDLYAAIFAANSIGIKTVDFQHGPQTNVHMAYANWLKVPKDGYNIISREFWNWDNNSKNNIEAWAKHIKGIKAKVIGQPYIAYCMNKQNGINNNEKVILYSMQTSPLELFTPELIKLVKLSMYKWIARLHPRNNESMENINRFLKSNELNEKIFIQDPTEEPLPKVLNRTVLHITNYSGCTLEAIMMGVPTILVHKVGHEMFNLYIDDHLVYYLDQKNEDFESNFMDLIKDFKRIENKKNYNEILNPLTM